MAEVVCVGVAFLDYVFEVDDLSPRAGRSFATDYTMVGGGMAATGAVAVSRLGGRAVFWGSLGDDEVADLILAELAADNVDISHVKRTAGAQSSMSAIQLDPARDRRISAFPGRGLDADPDWLPVMRIEEASAVLADPRWPEAAELVLSQSLEHRVPTILDGSLGPQPVPQSLVGLASHVIFSAAGLAQFTDRDDRLDALNQVAGQTDAMVGVTAGADGFYWLDEDGGCCHVPAPAIDAVDTLGAGEVFHGAFALAIGEGKDVATAGRFATVAASLKCSAHGRAGIPSRRDVWQRLDSDQPADAAAG